MYTAVRSVGHLLLSSASVIPSSTVTVTSFFFFYLYLFCLQCELPPQSRCTALVQGCTLPGVLWALMLLTSVQCQRWSGITQPTGTPEARWDASHRGGPAQIGGTLQDERQAAWTQASDIYVSELNFHVNEFQCLCVLR